MLKKQEKTRNFCKKTVPVEPFLLKVCALSDFQDTSFKCGAICLGKINRQRIRTVDTHPADQRYPALGIGKFHGSPTQSAYPTKKKAPPSLPMVGPVCSRYA